MTEWTHTYTPSELMPLDDALRILAAAHTQDDKDRGFYVAWTPAVPSFTHTREDYIRAWMSVRAHLKLQVVPPGRLEALEERARWHGGLGVPMPEKSGA